jgi:hypothetical protein
VRRGLKKLKGHIATYPLRIDTGAPILEQAYKDVRHYTNKLRIFCSPQDVGGFRANIGHLKDALNEYGKAISTLHGTVAVGFTAGSAVLKSTITQLHAAEAALTAANEAAAPVLPDGQSADALRAASQNAVKVLKAVASTIKKLFDATVQEVPASNRIVQAQDTLIKTVAILEATVDEENAVCMQVAAQKAVSDAAAVRDAVSHVAYTKPQLRAAAGWPTYGIQYAQELLEETPQVLQREEAPATAGPVV